MFKKTNFTHTKIARKKIEYLPKEIHCVAFYFVQRQEFQSKSLRGPSVASKIVVVKRTNSHWKKSSELGHLNTNLILFTDFITMIHSNWIILIPFHFLHFLLKQTHILPEAKKNDLASFPTKIWIIIINENGTIFHCSSFSPVNLFYTNFRDLARYFQYLWTILLFNFIFSFIFGILILVFFHFFFFS